MTRAEFIEPVMAEIDEAVCDAVELCVNGHDDARLRDQPKAAPVDRAFRIAELLPGHAFDEDVRRPGAPLAGGRAL